MDRSTRFRDRQIRVHLSASELELAREKAAYLGVNMSEFIRTQITDGFIINYQLADLKKPVGEINRVGVNMNQIARHVNEVGAVSRSEFTELENLYDELLDKYIMLALDGIARPAKKDVGNTDMARAG